MWFKRRHKHAPVDDIFWIDGMKVYGQVCECDATRYMTIAVHFPESWHRGDIWTPWKSGTTWQKYRPKEVPKPPRRQLTLDDIRKSRRTT